MFYLAAPFVSWKEQLPLSLWIIESNAENLMLQNTEDTLFSEHFYQIYKVSFFQPSVHSEILLLNLGCNVVFIFPLDAIYTCQPSGCTSNWRFPHELSPSPPATPILSPNFPPSTPFFPSTPLLTLPPYNLLPTLYPTYPSPAHPYP